MNSYVVLRGVGDLRLEKGPVQEIEPHEVLVRMSWVGICGSDVSLAYKGKLADYELEPPLGVGHEASGVVVKCGSSVKNLKPGDRVALEPGDPCGSCQFCRGGHYNTCETSCFHSSPVPNPGCLGHYYKHRADLCHKLPDTVSLEEGALIEPFAVAIHACRRSGVSMGTSVLICGAGPLGLLGLVTAKAMGASNILVTDIKARRLEVAKQMGAHHTLLADGSEPRAFAQRVKQTMGCMPEVSLECSGVESALATAIYATRMCGVVMVMGLPAKDVTLPIVNAAIREVDIRGVFRYVNCYPIAIEMISKGLVNLKALITHSFKFGDFQKAFEICRDGADGVIKCLISCE